MVYAKTIIHLSVGESDGYLPRFTSTSVNNYRRKASNQLLSHSFFITLLQIFPPEGQTSYSVLYWPLLLNNDPKSCPINNISHSKYSTFCYVFTVPGLKKWEMTFRRSDFGARLTFFLVHTRKIHARRLCSSRDHDSSNEGTHLLYS